MPFDLSQIEALDAAETDVALVGRIPETVANHIGAQLREVYLSHRSFKHIQVKHPTVTSLDLLWLPMVIERGLWIAEKNRPNCACVTWQNPETAHRYIGAVKVAGSGFEIYISTFHRAAKRQTRSLLKRGPILQTHW
jgi:hypothetical protein